MGILLLPNEVNNIYIYKELPNGSLMGYWFTNTTFKRLR